jgi:hypothetical protein
MSVFRVKQTRVIDISTDDPGDAADAARFLFRNEEIPPLIKNKIFMFNKIKIIKLEVDELEED